MDSYFQDIIIPTFAWLVFLIILGAFVAWAFRVWRAFRKNELDRVETLGLPKGTVRSFIVITFTGIMFLLLFGEFADIVAEDRKWFLTAYGSVLAFYFGTKYFPERFSAWCLSFSRVSPPVSHLPRSDSAAETLIISGSGFESPRGVTVRRDGQDLATSGMEAASRDEISINVTLSGATPVGPYDVIVELANGSRIVKTSAYAVEPANPASSTDPDRDAAA